jgi:hypothetical protein
MQDAFMFCRWANQALSGLAFLFLMARLVPLLFGILNDEQAREPVRVHRLALFIVLALYVVVTGFAAYLATQNGSPATWTSMALTALHLCTIVLCWWWPPSTYSDDETLA